MQAGADGQRDAPEEVLPPEAEHADDGEVRREAVHGGPHDEPPAVLPPRGRRQPRPGEHRPHAPRGAVVLPVGLRELGGRHRGVLGAVDRGRRRRGRELRRGGGGAPGLGGEVGVAADVEAVGLAEAVEAEERERGAEDEQVQEEDHQPEHVPALPPRPRRGHPRRRRRRGPCRRRGARVPAPVAGGGGRGHGGDRGLETDRRVPGMGISDAGRSGNWLTARRCCWWWD